MQPICHRNEKKVCGRRRRRRLVARRGRRDSTLVVCLPSVPSDMSDCRAAHPSSGEGGKAAAQQTRRVARLMKTKGLGLEKGGNFPGGAPAAR